MFFFIILKGVDIFISLIQKIIWTYISKIKILNGQFDSKTWQQPKPTETCILKTREQKKPLTNPVTL